MKFKCMTVLRMVPALCAVLLCQCKSPEHRAKHMLAHTVAPPLMKLTATMLSPFAGKETTRKMQELDSKGQLGEFYGEAHIEQIAPNLFWFHQSKDPAKRFGFRSRIGLTEGMPEWRIEPGDLFFDGASVPRWLWNVYGLGPMDFAKSALIHDWLFEAHHRHEIYNLALNNLKCTSCSETEVKARIKLYEKLKTRYADYAAGSLDVKKAGWIMAETIYREMLTAKAQIGIVQCALKQESRNREQSANTLLGLRRLDDSLRIAEPRPWLLGYYRWAVSSFIARDIFSPEDADAEKLGRSPHASTVSTVEALLKAYKPGQQPEVIPPALYARFLELVEDHAAPGAARVLASRRRSPPKPSEPDHLLETLVFPFSQALQDAGLERK